MARHSKYRQLLADAKRYQEYAAKGYDQARYLCRQGYYSAAIGVQYNASLDAAAAMSYLSRSEQLHKKEIV